MLSRVEFVHTATVWLQRVSQRRLLLFAASWYWQLWLLVHCWRHGITCKCSTTHVIVGHVTERFPKLCTYSYWPKFHLARHVSTRSTCSNNLDIITLYKLYNELCCMPSESSSSCHACRTSRARHVKRAKPCCSTSSTQAKCIGSTHQTCRVVSCRDVMSQVEVVFEQYSKLMSADYAVLAKGCCMESRG